MFIRNSVSVGFTAIYCLCSKMDSFVCGRIVNLVFFPFIFSRLKFTCEVHHSSPIHTQITMDFFTYFPNTGASYLHEYQTFWFRF